MWEGLFQRRWCLINRFQTMLSAQLDKAEPVGVRHWLGRHSPH